MYIVVLMFLLPPIQSNKLSRKIWVLWPGDKVKAVGHYLHAAEQFHWLIFMTTNWEVALNISCLILSSTLEHRTAITMCSKGVQCRSLITNNYILQLQISHRSHSVMPSDPCTPLSPNRELTCIISMAPTPHKDKTFFWKFLLRTQMKNVVFHPGTECPLKSDETEGKWSQLNFKKPKI